MVNRSNVNKTSNRIFVVDDIYGHLHLLYHESEYMSNDILIKINRH